jgi:hypothetical protein
LFRYTWKHGITPRQSDIVPNYILNNTALTDCDNVDGIDADASADDKTNADASADDKTNADANSDDKTNADASAGDKTNADAISDDNSKGLTLVKRGLRISLTLRKART